MPDLTEHAEDQLRRLREHIATPIIKMDGSPMRPTFEGAMCVTASRCNGSEVPAIWRDLEESGHVTITWADPYTAYVKPVA